MRVPMTAREQLLAARERGHELTVESTLRDDQPNSQPKFWVVCTCGYRSTARRSVAATNSTMIWHLGKAISEDLPKTAS